MKRRLQFGCGPRHLPAPWENFDRDVDIRKPLPFPDSSAQFVLAEHVIEHIPFAEGLHFLAECHRVLEPGGVLRLGFPDITRIDTLEPYAGLLRKHGIHVKTVEEVWLSILTEWGHQSCWTRDMAMRSLRAAGFDCANPRPYWASNYSELNEIELHHITVGWDVATNETTVIEALK